MTSSRLVRHIGLIPPVRPEKPLNLACCAANATERLMTGEEGATLVEMAFTMVTLFTFLFCFMELCLAFYTHSMISERAREGTRYAMVRGASCPSTSSPTCMITSDQLKTFVQSIALPDIAGGTMTVVPSYPDGDEAVGHRVQVQITYNFAIKMPFVPSTAIAMSSTSVAYIVQ